MENDPDKLPQGCQISKPFSSRAVHCCIAFKGDDGFSIPEAEIKKFAKSVISYARFSGFFLIKGRNIFVFFYHFDEQSRFQSTLLF